MEETGVVQQDDTDLNDAFKALTIDENLSIIRLPPLSQELKNSLTNWLPGRNCIGFKEFDLYGAMK
jgi:hypothetical protein